MIEFKEGDDLLELRKYQPPDNLAIDRAITEENFSQSVVNDTVQAEQLNEGLVEKEFEAPIADHPGEPDCVADMILSEPEKMISPVKVFIPPETTIKSIAVTRIDPLTKVKALVRTIAKPAQPQEPFSVGKTQAPGVIIDKRLNVIDRFFIWLNSILK